METLARQTRTAVVLSQLDNDRSLMWITYTNNMAANREEPVYKRRVTLTKLTIWLLYLTIFFFCVKKKKWKAFGFPLITLIDSFGGVPLLLSIFIPYFTQKAPAASSRDIWVWSLCEDQTGCGISLLAPLMSRLPCVFFFSLFTNTVHLFIYYLTTAHSSFRLNQAAIFSRPEPIFYGCCHANRLACSCVLVTV